MFVNLNVISRDENNPYLVQEAIGYSLPCTIYKRLYALLMLSLV